MDQMTLQELESKVVKININTQPVSVEESDEVIREIEKLQEKKVANTITREEEVIFWMFLNVSDRPAAERWTAIVRGELTPGTNENGIID